jgi:LisH domain-containing protein ARMC9
MKNNSEKQEKPEEIPTKMPNTSLQDTAKDEEIKILRAKLTESESKYNALLEKETTIKDLLIQSQSKWTLFTNEIVSMCYSIMALIENEKKGHPINQQQLEDMKIKINKYKEFVSQYQQDLNASDDKPKPPLQSEAVSNPVNENNEPTPLNYLKIREFLMTSTDHLKICSLLQAIRWRITRAKHGVPRKHVLYSYTQNDILGCKENKSAIVLLLSIPNRK